MGRDGGPPVELERFRAFMREAGIEPMVEGTLEVYLRESAQRVQRIHDALAAGQLPLVEGEAHAFKSGSLNVWAVDLAHLLDRVEQAAARGDLQEARAAAQGLEDAWAEVSVYLEGILEAGP